MTGFIDFFLGGMTTHRLAHAPINYDSYGSTAQLSHEFSKTKDVVVVAAAAVFKFAL